MLSLFFHSEFSELFLLFLLYLCNSCFHFAFSLKAHFAFCSDLCIAFELVIFPRLINAIIWKFWNGFATYLQLSFSRKLHTNLDILTNIKISCFLLAHLIYWNHIALHVQFFILFACTDYNSVFRPSFVFCTCFFFPCILKIKIAYFSYYIFGNHNAIFNNHKEKLEKNAIA